MHPSHPDAQETGLKRLVVQTRKPVLLAQKPGRPRPRRHKAKATGRRHAGACVKRAGCGAGSLSGHSLPSGSATPIGPQGQGASAPRRSLSWHCGWALWQGSQKCVVPKLPAARARAGEGGGLAFLPALVWGRTAWVSRAALTPPPEEGGEGGALAHACPVPPVRVGGGEVCVCVQGVCACCVCVVWVRGSVRVRARASVCACVCVLGGRGVPTHQYHTATLQQ